MITFLNYREDCNCIEASDGRNGKYIQINKQGRVIKEESIGAAITSSAEFNNEKYYTAIRNIEKNAKRTGILLQYNQGVFRTILSGLNRPVDVINFKRSESEKGLIVTEFGNTTGQLAYYSYNHNRFFNKKVLKSIPGMVAIEPRSAESFLALTAQGIEQISEFKLTPESIDEKILVEYPPSYGGVDMKYTDLNTDGNKEIIVTHGDNGDLKSRPVKQYQGIRVYEGYPGSIKLKYYYSMPGAYKFTANDFNNDGYKDIAVTAYFYDRREKSPLNLIMLINKGDNTFSECRLPVNSKTSLLTIASGDIDKDGDIDLFLSEINTDIFYSDQNNDRNNNADNRPVYLLFNSTSDN